MSTEQKPQIPHIVFESGDFENDIEMLLIEKEGEFYLNLHNSSKLYCKFCSIQFDDFIMVLSKKYNFSNTISTRN
jgi:hypothetical protein